MPNTTKYTTVFTYYPERRFCGLPARMVKLMAIILLLTLICAIGVLCLTKPEKDAAFRTNICELECCKERSELLLNSMDQAVDPCEDFYSFVCGKFQENTVIPDNQTSVTRFSMLRDQVNEQIRTILEESLREGEPKFSRLMKHHYQVCMNETAIEDDGITTMKTYLNELGGWPVLDANWTDAGFNWTRILLQFKEKGFVLDYLFDISVLRDIVNSSVRVIYIDAPMLGINKRYLRKNWTDPYFEAYYNYMADVAKYFGADEEKALKDMKEVLLFEQRLAEISTNVEDLEDDVNYYENATIGSLNERYGFLKWDRFFDSLINPPEPFNSTERIIVNDPLYLNRLEGVINATNHKVLANYLLWRTVKENVEYLSSDLRRIQLKFHKVFYGKSKMSSRWETCVTFTKNHFSVALSAAYVKRYFNREKKKLVEEIVDDIKSAFGDSIQNSDWMDAETKERALEKLQKMESNVGYPEELLNDTLVDQVYESYQDISAGDFTYLKLIRQVYIRAYRDVYKNLRKMTAEDNAWRNKVFAHEVNAFYSSTNNQIVVPAAILQGIFFKQHLPNYVNFGSIGLAIGHELVHGFDAKGRKFDKDGNAKNWWEEKTLQAYINKTKCIENQYSNYNVDQVNLRINGKHTLDENIADNGGMRETYAAYEHWLKKNNGKEEPGLPDLKFTNKQLFWISSASVWCAKLRDEQMRSSIFLNPHSPHKYRTIGMLSNMQEFSDDFNCKLNSTMNPETKCSLW